jgi:hypothetical protein
MNTFFGTTTATLTVGGCSTLSLTGSRSSLRRCPGGPLEATKDRAALGYWNLKSCARALCLVAGARERFFLAWHVASILFAVKPTFAGCRKRIDGAADDFKALNEQFTALKKAHGQPVRLRQKAQPERQRVVYNVEWIMSLPSDWDRRIAHILYDVRSALDHLVHELYVASNGKRPPKRTVERLQFPICTTSRAFTNDLRHHRLDGLDKRFIKIVRKHQPYRLKRPGTRPTNHAFERLRRLSDLDKHRRPNVVFMAPTNFRFEVKVLGGSTPRLVPVGAGKALKVGTEFAHIYVEPWPTHLRMQVKGHGTFGPGLERGIFIPDLLAKVITEARVVIDECEAEWLATAVRRPHEGRTAVKGIVPSI